jgi:hypothetical protein
LKLGDVEEVHVGVGVEVGEAAAGIGDRPSVARVAALKRGEVT